MAIHFTKHFMCLVLFLAHYYISYSVICSLPLKQFMAVKKSSMLTRDLPLPGFSCSILLVVVN